MGKRQLLTFQRESFRLLYNSHCSRISPLRKHSKVVKITSCPYFMIFCLSSVLSNGNNHHQKTQKFTSKHISKAGGG